MTSMAGTARSRAAKLTPSQHRAWLSYMPVYHRLEYEMNRHLQSELDETEREAIRAERLILTTRPS
jgi:hypothetical protein